MLFDSVAFKNVACLGLILDGEGQKMSKSRGNSVDPWAVLDKHGADAFRWYLYTASPAGQERRFSVDLVGAVVRNFTLTLWNTYAFFVTYANLDRWLPGGGAPPLRSDLDKWILSELHALTRDVSHALENYDATGATRPIEGFIDLLSNWYVRLSRRRFWKSEDDGDKQAAYATLYECLLTASELLAPSMPFIADALYRNLALSADPAAPESVHLADWPEFDADVIDETLNHEMRLVQKLVSLGHNGRQRARLKVRQPLAEAAFWAGSHAGVELIARYADLIAEELNVKKVRSLDSVTEAIAYSLHPLPKQLGQKYGKRFPAIRQALLALPPTETARALLAGEAVAVQLAAEAVEVMPDEVEVRLTAKEGFAVAEESGLVAALVTELTPELLREGLAREVVRRVQDLRKSSGFEISDRIHIAYAASGQLAQAIEEQRAYIMGEALASSLTAAKKIDDATLVVEGEKLSLRLERVT